MADAHSVAVVPVVDVQIGPVLPARRSHLRQVVQGEYVHAALGIPGRIFEDLAPGAIPVQLGGLDRDRRLRVDPHGGLVHGGGI